MTIGQKIYREAVLREVDVALGKCMDVEGDPGPTAWAMWNTLQALKVTGVIVPQSDRTDYLAAVQKAAQAAWHAKHSPDAIGPEHDAIAGVDTPIGRFKATTWRCTWSNGKVAWASEYSLNDEPIVIAEIKASGLARRPTTRNRKRRGNGEARGPSRRQRVFELEVGETITVPPSEAAAWRVAMWDVAKGTGQTYVSRTVEDGVRISRKA